MSRWVGGEVGGDWADDEALKALEDLEGVEVEPEVEPGVGVVEGGGEEVKREVKEEAVEVMDPLNVARVEVEKEMVVGEDNTASVVADVPHPDALSNTSNPLPTTNLPTTEAPTTTTTTPSTAPHQPPPKPLRRARSQNNPSNHDSGVFILGDHPQDDDIPALSILSSSTSDTTTLDPTARSGSPGRRPRMSRSHTSVGRGVRPDPIITNSTSAVGVGRERTGSTTYYATPRPNGSSSETTTATAQGQPGAVEPFVIHPGPNGTGGATTMGGAEGGEGSALVDKLTTAVENMVSDPWGVVSGWLRSSRAEERGGTGYVGTVGGFGTGGGMGRVERKRTVG
ncbi:hypothetical protein HDV00_005303 [Rhizophlyctis rosea]|nr:hypothetical protein HDV00_005303 [Rhizophlyctis rosea]